MNLSVRQEQTLEPELKIEQRLELNQRLEQRLSQQLEVTIELEQYLKQEETIKEFIEWVNKHNSWTNFNKDDFNFKYAVLPYKIAKPIADKCGPGFAHCFYNPFESIAKGDWTLFVVKDMIDLDFEDIIAMHERGEELSLGNHYFASQLEFAYVSKKRKVGEYNSFIGKKYPGKFVDLTQEVLFPILPDELKEFLNEKQKNKEIETAEKLINKYPLPTSVLRLMDKYGKITDNLSELLRVCAGKIQKELYNSKLAKKTYNESADIVNNYLTDLLISLPKNKVRVTSKPVMDNTLENIKKTINHDVLLLTNKSLIFPIDFEQAHKNAKEGKRLVNFVEEEREIINLLSLPRSYDLFRRVYEASKLREITNDYKINKKVFENL